MKGGRGEEETTGRGMERKEIGGDEGRRELWRMGT